MPLPSSADQVVIQGVLLDERTGRGETAQITSAPVPLTGQNTTRPLVLAAADHVHIRTNTRTTTPDPSTGYWAMLALSSNDPDLTAYGGRSVTLPGEAPKTIEIPWDAPQTTVTSAMAAQLNANLQVPVVAVGDLVRVKWFDECASFTAPQPPDGYLTSSQTVSAIESGIDAHDADTRSHPDLRAAINAVAAAVPEQARDAIGAALVAGQNVSITPDDGADTITIAVTIPPSGYGDEQAQDAAAAALAAGSHSGVSFTYDDAGNAISAAVTYGTTSSSSARGDDARIVGAQQTSAKGQPSGYAALDSSGKVPQTQLPAVAIADYLGEVASQSAMLALTGQRGDWCTRTDRGTDWQLVAEPSSSLSSWRERVYPASPVQSVNGRQGAVTGLAEQTAVDTAIAGRQPLDSDLTVIAGLDATQVGVLASEGSGWLRRTYTQVKASLGLTKDDVGLGNVANTAPADLPVSAATQAALDALIARAPAWAPNTTYRVGELVWQAGQLFRRKAAGASGTTFDAAAWDLVGPSSGGGAGDRLGVIQPRPGDWSLQPIFTTTGGRRIAAGDLTLGWHWLPPGDYDRAAFAHYQAGGAGVLTRVVVYADDSGAPAALLAESPGVDSSDANDRTRPVTLSVSAGSTGRGVWCGVVCSAGTTPNVAVLTAAMSQIADANPPADVLYARPSTWRTTGVGVNAPATGAGMTRSSAESARIGFRRA